MAGGPTGAFDSFGPPVGRLVVTSDRSVNPGGWSSRYSTSIGFPTGHVRQPAHHRRVGPVRIGSRCDQLRHLGLAELGHVQLGALEPDRQQRRLGRRGQERNALETDDLCQRDDRGGAGAVQIVDAEENSSEGLEPALDRSAERRHWREPGVHLHPEVLREIRQRRHGRRRMPRHRAACDDDSCAASLRTSLDEQSGLADPRLAGQHHRAGVVDQSERGLQQRRPPDQSHPAGLPRGPQGLGAPWPRRRPTPRRARGRVPGPVARAPVRTHRERHRVDRRLEGLDQQHPSVFVEGRLGDQPFRLGDRPGSCIVGDRGTQPEVLEGSADLAQPLALPHRLGQLCQFGQRSAAPRVQAVLGGGSGRGGVTCRQRVRSGCKLSVHRGPIGRAAQSVPTGHGGQSASAQLTSDPTDLVVQRRGGARRRRLPTPPPPTSSRPTASSSASSESSQDRPLHRRQLLHGAAEPDEIDRTGTEDQHPRQLFLEVHHLLGLRRR